MTVKVQPENTSEDLLKRIKILERAVVSLTQKVIILESHQSDPVLHNIRIGGY